MRITAYGPGGPPPYRPQDGASSQTAWRARHYGEAFGAVTPEAYVPHMVDREYALEEDRDSFLGPGWEEEAPEAELFQEPREGPVGYARSNDYRVPLIPQEQAYANHGPQDVQVATMGGCPTPAASYPSGGGRWGLQERDRDPASPPRRSEQGVLRR